MKKLSILLSFCAIALFAQEASMDHRGEVASLTFRPLSAATAAKWGVPEEAAPVKEEVVSFTSHFQFGANYTHARITPYGFNDYNGNLVGAQVLYEFKTFDRIYGGMSVRWCEGKESGEIGTMDFRNCDVQERIGYSFSKGNALISLYTGFGFRYLRQALEPKVSAPATFMYEEFYVPVGFLYDYQYSCNFSVGLYGVWMPQVYPTLTIEPIGGARWILAKTLKNGRVEMPFTFGLDRFSNTTFVFKPFAEYWQDGKTVANAVNGTTLGVPRNTYLFVGIDVNICYSF
jgi:hypothetical protein